MKVKLEINGRSLPIDVPHGTSLLGALRDDLGLTGTRYGCGHGACGACYVLVDGEPHPACKLAVEDLAGKRITTIEGLAADGELNRVQRAFVEEEAFQCGYCTPGMIVSATALLARTARPTEAEIRAALAHHLCRCGVYQRALRAVAKAAQAGAP